MQDPRRILCIERPRNRWAAGGGGSWARAVCLVPIAFLLALVVVSCGEGDPFVGAWAVGDYPSPMAIIAKAPAEGSYLVTMKPGSTGQTAVPFVRHGDTITATVDFHDAGLMPPRTFSFTRTPGGNLTYLERDARQTFAKVEVQRLSDSTMLLSPGATKGSP